MVLTTDKLTSVLGVLLGVSHQLGMVGTLPTTRQDWLNTATSLALGILGYYTNKH